MFVPNQVCYLDSQEALTLALLQASKNNRVLSGKEELRTNQAYLKSEAEMAQLFDEKTLAATRSLLLKCEATIPMHEMHLLYIIRLKAQRVQIIYRLYAWLG